MSDETKCPYCGAVQVVEQYGGLGVYECGNRTMLGVRPPACITIARLTKERDEAREDVKKLGPVLESLEARVTALGGGIN